MVLVEDDCLFLPNLLAKLAQQGLIDNIIIISSPFSWKRFLKNIRRFLEGFGYITAIKICISILMAKILNILAIYRFYSVKKVASVYDIPIICVKKLHSQEVYKIIDQISPDIVFTQVTQLVKKTLLDKSVFWNKHCSLLPSYGGVYPVFWSMLNSECYLGVTIHKMDESFDTGTILSQAQIPNVNLTFFEAYHQLYDLAGNLIIDLLISNKGKALGKDVKKSYFSFPNSQAKKQFLKSNKMGFPFRLHKPVTPQKTLRVRKQITN